MAGVTGTRGVLNDLSTPAWVLRIYITVTETNMKAKSVPMFTISTITPIGMKPPMKVAIIHTIPTAVPGVDFLLILCKGAGRRPSLLIAYRRRLLA
jgi:hypothetical protein